MARLLILARPGSSRDAVAWDRWRQRWTVSCREPATDGRANDALLALLAEVLEVPATGLRWVQGARSRTKMLEVDGLAPEDIDRRLRSRAAPSGAPPHRAPAAPPRPPG